MVMRIKVQYICMAFLYVGGFPLYAQKVTDDTISGKTHYIDEVTVKASVATRKVTSTTPVQVFASAITAAGYNRYSRCFASVLRCECKRLWGGWRYENRFSA